MKIRQEGIQVILADPVYLNLKQCTEKKKRLQQYKVLEITVRGNLGGQEFVRGWRVWESRIWNQPMERDGINRWGKAGQGQGPQAQDQGQG